MTKLFNISRFAEIVSSTAKTLRLYESKKLLLPEYKDANGYRKYSIHQRDRFIKIKNLQNLGFSLDEIRSMLPFVPQDKQMIAIFKQQRIKLDHQRKELEKKIEALSKLITAPHKGVKSLKREVYMKALSEHIKKLSSNDLKEFTKEISAEDYLITLSMIDEEAKNNLFSILSNKAKKIVEDDLQNLKSDMIQKWS